MKLRTLAVLIVVLVIAALCCAGCLQELPLGDKYINEAVGHLQVRNTSTDASYIITAVELRNSTGEIIKTWEGLGSDGQGLRQGETWIGDLDLEGSFTLYCTVSVVWTEGGEEKKTEEVYEYGAVTIKLHEVTESQIVGEDFYTDTDNDGFSDFWENAHKNEGFNPEDPGDGGTVYVSASAAEETGLGTKAKPYKSLAKGVEKAKSGLTEETRTVLVEGVFSDATEGSSNTALVHITGTGPRGLTIRGVGTATVDAAADNSNMRRPFYLGPGAKLTLENIVIINGRMFQGTGIYADGAALTLGPGTVIQNCSGSTSGAVYGSNGAVITMESGSLIGDDDLVDTKPKGNDGWAGVGVAVTNGSSLTMKGGSRITGNTFLGGGAVLADLGSLITLEPGAEITNNKDRDPAAQTSSHGGGVRLTRGSRLLMTGGLISGNVITKSGIGGGGVYVGSESVFDMRGGKISANHVGKSDGDTGVVGNGGGVYVDSGGQFNMSGGEIANNTATGQGGGVYVNGGKFFKTGGAVYGSGDSGKNTAGDGNTAGKGHAFFATDPARPADNTLPDSFTL
jgi:hypothetical protein